MHHRLVGLPPDDDPQQRLQRGGVHAHGRRGREGPNRVSDGPVLGRVRRVLPKARRTAHPHIDHHRVIVPRDGTGECVRLRATQAVEPHNHAAIRRIVMGSKATRADALRVLQCLHFVMRPSDAGRERGDDGRSDLQRPIGADDLQRLREGTRIGVPRTGGSEIGVGGRAQERDEVSEREGSDGFVAGGGVHGRIVRERGANV